MQNRNLVSSLLLSFISFISEMPARGERKTSFSVSTNQVMSSFSMVIWSSSLGEEFPGTRISYSFSFSFIFLINYTRDRSFKILTHALKSLSFSEWWIHPEVNRGISFLIFAVNLSIELIIHKRCTKNKNESYIQKWICLKGTQKANNIHQSKTCFSMKGEYFFENNISLKII